MAFCPKCGASNWDTVSFCSSCGAPLELPTSDESPVEPRPDVDREFFCPRCGEKHRQADKFCKNCGLPLRHIQRTGVRAYPSAERVDNHLVKAILATLFCCLPLGIVAIVYAAQVDGKAREGDIDGAMYVSRQADKWGNWAIGLGIASAVIYILFAIITTIAGA